MTIRMMRPLAVPVLGLLLTAAILTAPRAAGDADACDPTPSDAENSCAGKPPDTWPLAQGNFTSPGDPGWIFFRPFYGPAGYTGPKADAARVQYGCGIGPDGTVGCDHVPGNPFGNTDAYRCGELRCPLPPPGTNQTVAGPQEPGRYVHSDVATFTRSDVGELPEGHRLANGDAWCAVGYQGSISCVSGANGFTLAWWGGVLERWAQPPLPPR
jgi:hypothetical protein